MDGVRKSDRLESVLEARTESDPDRPAPFQSTLRTAIEYGDGGMWTGHRTIYRRIHGGTVAGPLIHIVEGVST